MFLQEIIPGLYLVAVPVRDGPAFEDLVALFTSSCRDGGPDSDSEPNQEEQEQEHEAIDSDSDSNRDGGGVPLPTPPPTPPFIAKAATYLVAPSPSPSPPSSTVTNAARRVCRGRREERSPPNQSPGASGGPKGQREVADQGGGEGEAEEFQAEEYWWQDFQMGRGDAAGPGRAFCACCVQKEWSRRRA